MITFIPYYIDGRKNISRKMMEITEEVWIKTSCEIKTLVNELGILNQALRLGLFFFKFSINLFFFINNFISNTHLL